MTEAAQSAQTTAPTANVTVASNIKAELARLDAKPADLARTLGENEMWLSRRLSSKVLFSTNEVQEIAEILGVEVGRLFARQYPATGNGLLRRHLYLMDSVGPAGIEPTTITV